MNMISAVERLLSYLGSELILWTTAWRLTRVRRQLREQLVEIPIPDSFAGGVCLETPQQFCPPCARAGSSHAWMSGSPVRPAVLAELSSR